MLITKIDSKKKMYKYNLSYIVRRIKKIHKKQMAGLIRITKRNAIYTCWFDRVANFGDLLNPVLLTHYGLTAVNISKDSSEVLAIGSILDNLKEGYSGYIIGSGLMFDTYQRFPNAKILAVRGELTRERIYAPESTPLGDPGLLVPLLFEISSEKKYVLGIVPHYNDENDKRLQKIKNNYQNVVNIINVQKKPEQVISEIAECQYILSSSLHGIITADALGIPNAWIKLSDKVGGNGFKFFDYASALKIKMRPKEIIGDESVKELLELTHPIATDNISKIQEMLDYIFREFSKEILDVRQSKKLFRSRSYCS